MDTVAVIFEQPEQLRLGRLPLAAPGDSDVVVEVDWSGISTGTERLLWTGRMPPFPGMGYPLIPGYEAAGRVSSAGARSGRRVGDTVFVPGARCYGDVRGLFGGASARLVVPGARAHAVPDGLGERSVLLALAATACHAVAAQGASLPELIIGHGVLGRLIARLVPLLGGSPPTVWERNPVRGSAGQDYRVVRPEDDTRRDYSCICDASGDAGLLDELISRLAPGGEIVLAGFYSERLSFAFPPAFMREARLRVAAEWREADLLQVSELIAAGRLSLDGLITHREAAASAAAAYRTAFEDPSCLKMVLDWSSFR